MSPFQVVYGRQPPTLVTINTEAESKNKEAHGEILQRERVLEQLKQNLKEAQHRMKEMADKHRRDVQFKEGDMVLVRLQPYRQVSITDHKYSKLRRRYYGPFPVLKCIGPVAYKIGLPESARIHPVFHVSKLKAYREDKELHSPKLPNEIQEGKLVVSPTGILQQRVLNVEGTLQKQMLVQWEGLGPENATWVTLDEFKEGYPLFNLEDKVVFEEEGNDRRWGRVFERRNKRLERDSREARKERTAGQQARMGELDSEQEAVDLEQGIGEAGPAGG